MPKHTHPEITGGNIITVAISGGVHTSIATALGVASSGDTIIVYPGTYTEPAMTIPAGVVVNGIDRQNCIISASDINNPLFTAGSGTSIFNLTLQGVTNDACILDNSTATNNHFENLIFKTSQEGIKISGVNTRCFVDNIIAESTITRALYSISTGTGGIVIHGIFSDAITTLQADSGGIWSFDVFITGGTNGAYANGGEIDLHTLDARDVTNVIRLNNSGRIEGEGIEVHGTNTTWDILQEDSGSSLDITSGILTSDKISAIDFEKLLITYDDKKEGDEALQIFKEFHVGLAECGKESVFGEGDSYTRGMLVYTENTSNVFVDVSMEARSFSGSTFTFTGVAADNFIYVASSLANSIDKLQHLGIKASIQAAAVLGAGEIVAEYWNGSAWTEFNHMSVDETSQHLPHAKDIFERTGFEQIRYNNLIKSDWTKNDPISPALGTTYFWIRYRIKTAITTAPIFEQWKLHSNRMESNDDGWTEFFGNARPITTISWDYNSAQPFGNSPGNQDLFVLNKTEEYEELGIGRVENSFADNSVSRVALVKFAPYDLDTSTPLTLRISWVPRGTGQMDWKVNFGIIRNGDTIATAIGSAGTSITGEQHLSELVTVTTPDVRHLVEIDIDVSEIIARRSTGESDEMWISIARDSRVGNTNDTISADIDVIQISPIYLKWSNGDHV